MVSHWCTPAHTHTHMHSRPKHPHGPALSLPQVLRGMPGGGLQSVPLHKRSDLEGTEAVVGEFMHECRMVRKALEGDLTKVGGLKGTQMFFACGICQRPGRFVLQLSCTSTPGCLAQCVVELSCI